ncbi:MAG: PilZ domain-containing protein [Lachnospiraceae bacterium]|nr:PilZ domain-containing protein [Lachnospiraceae bacterium]
MLEGNVVNILDEEKGIKGNVIGRYKVIENTGVNTYLIVPADDTSIVLMADYNYKLEYTLNNKAYSCYFNIDKDYVPKENKGLNIHVISQIKLINRRIHERYLCHIAIEYSKLEVVGGNELALINNISAGGLNFVTDKEIASETLLKMKFEIPDEDYKMSYDVTGKVVSCTKVNSDKLMYNIHVEFGELTKEEAENIIKYVFKLQRKDLEN